MSKSRRLPSWRTTTIVAVPVVALFAVAFGWPASQGGSKKNEVSTKAINVKSYAAGTEGLPDLPPPNLLRPLTAQQAAAANEERPVLAFKVNPAMAFRLTGEGQSQIHAIDCLSQAVYYEAASEGLDGGRAVAQVVLNRVRHRGFPNTVCGTIYQGSDRATGCQFTFTCDGSLTRVIVPSLWARSRKIAEEALAGRIFAAVGHATHYHADYVLPYWADSLDKVAVIGRHIFYQLRGPGGAREAFAQPYGGTEPLPPPILPVDTKTGIEGNLVGSGELPNPPAPKVEEDRIAALGGGQAAATKINQPLAADLEQGQLIVGEAGPALKPKVKVGAEPELRRADRLQPLGATDLRVTPHSVGR